VEEELQLNFGNPSPVGCCNHLSASITGIKTLGQGMYSPVYETYFAEFLCVNEVAMALNLTGNECVCFFSLLFAHENGNFKCCSRFNCKRKNIFFTLCCCMHYSFQIHGIASRMAHNHLS
jgi:hypothetical protein